MIQLRTLEEKDAAGMLEWMKDPEINCFFRFHADSMTLESCKSYIAESQKDPVNKHFAIVDENDQYLGTISLKNIDGKSAEYAISTRSCVHGTGAATEATRKLLTLAFEQLKLDRVYLNVLVENRRANRFYQKVGFRYERSEKNAVEIHNEWKDLNWYEISREDFLREEEDGK